MQVEGKKKQTGIVLIHVAFVSFLRIFIYSWSQPEACYSTRTILFNNFAIAYTQLKFLDSKEFETELTNIG